MKLTVPTALLTFVVKSNVFPVYIDALLTVIGQLAFPVVNDLVVLAALTVVVLAMLAVIVTDWLFPCTTVIAPVELLIVTPVDVLLLEYVIAPFVPPFVAAVAVAVYAVPYVNVAFADGVLLVQLKLFVYFCTVNVTFTLFCATVVVLALVTDNTTLPLLSLLADNTPAVYFLFVVSLLPPVVPSELTVAVNAPPLFPVTMSA